MKTENSRLTINEEPLFDMKKPSEASLLLDEAVRLLVQLNEQVDEDCPPENRTRHLRDAMMEANEFAKNYYSKLEGGK